MGVEKAHINKAFVSSPPCITSSKMASSVVKMSSRVFFSPSEHEVFSEKALKEFTSSGPLESRDIVGYLNQFFCYVQDPKLTGKNVIVSVWDHEKGFAFLHKTKKEAEDLLVPYKISLPVTTTVKGTPVTKSKQFPIFQLWFQSPVRRTCASFAFDPELPPGISEHSKYINLWRGYECYDFESLVVTERTKENLGVIEYHFQEVMYRGEEVLYGYTKKWMAHRVQYPHVCPGVALLLTGKQGAGKTQFFKYFSQALRPHAEYVMRGELLTGKYAGYVTDNMVFICCDEVDFTDKKVMNHVKTMIDGHKRHSEVKFGAVNQPKNYLGFAFTSNDPHCLSTEVGSEMRRWFHVECDDSMVGKHEYFQRLTLAYEEENGAAMKLLFKTLFEMDLGSFDIRDRPFTQELRSQQMTKLSDFDDWWLGCIRRGYHNITNNNNAAVSDWQTRDVAIEQLYGEFIGVSSRRKSVCPNLALFLEMLKQVLPFAENLSIENQTFEMPTYKECSDYARLHYKLDSDQLKVVTNQTKKRKTTDQRKVEDARKKKRAEVRARDCQKIDSYFRDNNNDTSRQSSTRDRSMEDVQRVRGDEGHDISQQRCQGIELIATRNGQGSFQEISDRDSQAGFFYDPQGVPFLEEESDGDEFLSEWGNKFL